MFVFFLKHNPSQRTLFGESLVKLLSIIAVTHTVIIIVLVLFLLILFIKSTESELLPLLTFPLLCPAELTMPIRTYGIILHTIA